MRLIHINAFHTFLTLPRSDLNVVFRHSSTDLMVPSMRSCGWTSRLTISSTCSHLSPSAGRSSIPSLERLQKWSPPSISVRETYRGSYPSLRWGCNTCLTVYTCWLCVCYVEIVSCCLCNFIHSIDFQHCGRKKIQDSELTLTKLQMLYSLLFSSLNILLFVFLCLFFYSILFSFPFFSHSFSYQSLFSTVFFYFPFPPYLLFCLSFSPLFALLVVFFPHFSCPLFFVLLFLSPLPSIIFILFSFFCFLPSLFFLLSFSLFSSLLPSSLLYSSIRLFFWRTSCLFVPLSLPYFVLFFYSSILHYSVFYCQYFLLFCSSFIFLPSFTFLYSSILSCSSLFYSCHFVAQDRCHTSTILPQFLL